MQTKDPVFPSNHLEIAARLWEYDYMIYELLDVWTCDEAAQIITGILPSGFIQEEADEFELISKIIARCFIAKSIDSFGKDDGVIYLKPLSVIKWAISKEFTLQEHTLGWYDDQLNKFSLFEIRSDIVSQIALTEPTSVSFNTGNQINNEQSKGDKEDSESLESDERQNQLHNFFWRTYQSMIMNSSNKKITAYCLWSEIQKNHQFHDSEGIIEEVTSDQISWISQYDNHQLYSRRSFDSCLSKLKRKF